MSRFLNAAFLVFVMQVAIAGWAVLALGTSPAQAVCGKECKQAKKFCSNYEKDHPGQECGTVRGAICTGKDWSKIKQVNWAWSACKLTAHEGEHSAAKHRCAEYKKFWGGACEIHSPHCKVGWVKLAKWGKFSACRKADLSGGVLYSGYKSFMRKFEGKAKHKIPAHLHPFLKKHYSFDPAKIRFGWVGEVKGAQCITDCFNIYCDGKPTIDRVKNGYLWQQLPFHELQHAEQCAKEGSRKAYALYWFKQVPGSFFKALNPKKVADFSGAFHDDMPMEKDAFKKAENVHAPYVSEWWHRATFCGVFKSDKKTNVGYIEDGKVHSRYYCDPDYNQTGAKELIKFAKQRAKDLGGGRYYYSFGRPDIDEGVWLGSIEIKHKIVEMSWAVNMPKGACPKVPTVKAIFATDGVRKIKVRINRDGNFSKWHTLQAKKVTGGYLAGLETKLSALLGPEQKHRFRLEIEGEEPTPWKTVEVKCPPLEVLSVSYTFTAEKGPLCPRNITTREVYTTNGPGRVRHRRERKDGPPSDWMRTKAKRVGDQYKLIIENTQKVGEINQVRRVAARRFNLRKGIIESKWVKFKVRCLDILESAIIYDGPATGTCRYKTGVRVRVNADMKGDIPYRLDCTDGQSATGTFAIRKTGPQSFIGVDTLKLDVKKTGKQICALKADVGSGMKSLTLQGKDLTCEDVLDAAVYIDGPAKASCPAELPVRVRVNGRNQHAVGFNLKCSTGDNWNGMLKVAKTGPGTYLGVMTKKIKVKETGKIVCALRSTLTGVSKIVALRGKDFQCVARAIPPSAGGLTTGRPRPKPRKLLALACKNGTARNGKCVCKSGWKVRKLAPRRFICDKPQARIRCVGGKTIRGRCVCPRGAVIKKARGGGIRCQCPRGTRLLRGICARPAG